MTMECLVSILVYMNARLRGLVNNTLLRPNLVNDYYFLYVTILRDADRLPGK